MTENTKEPVKIKCQSCDRDAVTGIVNLRDGDKVAVCQYHLMSFCQMIIAGGQRRIAEILKGKKQ